MYAALEGRYVAGTDEDDSAREIAERVRLALDGWSYNSETAMERRLADEPAEFIATSPVTPGTWPGQAESTFATGDDRKFRVTVTLVEEGSEPAPVVNAPELTAALKKTVCSASKISRVETGRVSVSPWDVRDMLELYGVFVEARPNSESQNWHRASFARPSEVANLNAHAGWQKYRVRTGRSTGFVLPDEITRT
jgi:hypothetical protein